MTAVYIYKESIVVYGTVDLAEMRRLRVSSIIRCITQPTIKKTFIVLVLLCLFSIWMLAIRIAGPRNATEESQSSASNNNNQVPPRFGGKRTIESAPVHTNHDIPHATTKQPGVKVALLFLENDASSIAENITSVLEANRIKYRTAIANRGDIPNLAYKGVGLYSVIIFENLFSYTNLSPPQKDVIDQYCKLYNIGVIAFTPSRDEENDYTSQIGSFPLYVDQHLSLKDLTLNPASNVYHITRTEATFKGPLPGEDWTVFRTNHSTYQPIARAKTGSHDIVNLSKTIPLPLHATVVHDRGGLDGIQRIFFGNDFRLWLHYLLFLDSIHFLTDGKLGLLSLERYILIDVDDIFVGLPGIRMKPEDVEVSYLFVCLFSQVGA